MKSKKNGGTPVKRVRQDCTYYGAILKQDHGNLGVAVVEHYKFCHSGTTETFDRGRTFLGLDIQFIAYWTQIFKLFPLQSNPRQLIGAPSFSSNFDQPHRQQSEMFKQCIGNIWFSTFWAGNLAIQILTWCTHHAGWWSLGKIMLLGDSFLHLPKLTRLLPLCCESGQMIVQQKDTHLCSVIQHLAFDRSA